jgi:hypothetical protein
MEKMFHGNLNFVLTEILFKDFFNDKFNEKQIKFKFKLVIHVRIKKNQLFGLSTTTQVKPRDFLKQPTADH